MDASGARHRFTSEQYDWGWKHFRGLKKLKSTQEGHRRPIIEGGSANITAFVRVLEDPTGVLWLT
jgi:ubiquitin carboxyl-terminal hydrolase 7